MISNIICGEVVVGAVATQILTRVLCKYLMIRVRFECAIWAARERVWVRAISLQRQSTFGRNLSKLLVWRAAVHPDATQTFVEHHCEVDDALPEQTPSSELVHCDITRALVLQVLSLHHGLFKVHYSQMDSDGTDASRTVPARMK